MARSSVTSGYYPLQGGPSYRYSYQELDPTELQYLQEQQQLYLQESEQAQPGASSYGHLGQTGFQAGQSYTQSYWQNYHGGRGRFAGLGKHQ